MSDNSLSDAVSARRSQRSEKHQPHGNSWVFCRDLSIQAPATIRFVYGMVTYGCEMLRMLRQPHPTVTADREADAAFTLCQSLSQAWDSGCVISYELQVIS